MQSVERLILQRKAFIKSLGSVDSVLHQLIVLFSLRQIANGLAVQESPLGWLADAEHHRHRDID